MKTRLWFEIIAAVLIGLVVLALLGPLGAIVYAIGSVGFLGRSGDRYRRSTRPRRYHH